MIFQALHRHSAPVAEALPRLVRLKELVGYESDLNMAQRLAFFALTLDFKPDAIVELGRGYGNSTTIFCEAARHLPGTTVFSYCLSDVWRTTVAPKIERAFGKNWFQQLRIFEDDITTHDFSPELREANSVLILWDAHGFDVAERMLTHVLPLVAAKRHVVLCHDVSDNRFHPPEAKAYQGRRFWRGMAESEHAPQETAPVNLGWCATRKDQFISLLDFCYRNGIDLHSADFEFRNGSEQQPQQLAALQAAVAPVEGFAKKFHFAYFTLNEAPGPLTFPAGKAQAATEPAALANNVVEPANRSAPGEQPKPAAPATTANTAPPRLALFAIPKPFSGHIGLIQRNAIRSWMALMPRPEILLLGNEAGTADVAREFGLRHLPDIELTAHGTPRLDSLFAVARAATSSEWLGFINSDILLLDDFPSALATLAGKLGQAGVSRFLLTSQRVDVDVREPLEFDGPSVSRLRAAAAQEGARMNKDAIDLFLFPRELYHDVLPLAIGRTAWDNYLVWKARQEGAAIVDATDAFLLLHQAHDYQHGGGWKNVWKGEEAQRNQELTRGCLMTVSQACTHLLDRSGLKPGSGTNHFNHARLALHRLQSAAVELERGDPKAAKDYIDDALQWIGCLQETKEWFEKQTGSWESEARKALTEAQRLSGLNRELEERLAFWRTQAETGHTVPLSRFFPAAESIAAAVRECAIELSPPSAKRSGALWSLEARVKRTGPKPIFRIVSLGAFKRRVTQVNVRPGDGPAEWLLSVEARLCRGWNAVVLECFRQGRWHPIHRQSVWRSPG